jgi:hypothetical protein
MQILLNSPITADESKLQTLYDKAIAEAIELYIVSAYLTGWKPSQELNAACQEICFIVGTDFGITTKVACRNVLKWLPKYFKSEFLAADRISSGFHPKLVAWRDANNQCHMVLGSSNLTEAAFTTNYEANVFTLIAEAQFQEIKTWVLAIRNQSSPISEDWLEGYEERSKSVKRKQVSVAPMVFDLPSGSLIDEAIRRRRKQQNEFARIKEQMADLIRKCAAGELTNEIFYEQMMSLWGSDSSRFQGRGFEIKGKHADWKNVCKSISVILTAEGGASAANLDGKVRYEIDRLAKAQNAVRTAWFSEMLCHYFPDHYPLMNKPVITWLRHIKYQAPLNASEGARYIHLARNLRHAIEGNTKNEARNLAELDHGIWRWWDSTVRNSPRPAGTTGN